MSTRFRTLSLIAILVVVAGAAWAVPPSPEAKAKFIQEGTWEQKAAILRAFEAAMTPEMLDQSLALHLDRHGLSMATGVEAVDTVRLCVILMEFPDFGHDDTFYSSSEGSVSCLLSATPAMFDSLLFSEQGKDPVFNDNGSMTEYYLEVSYGNYYIQGDVFGWYTAPNNYSYYVGYDAGGSNGSQLAREAVIAADNAGVNLQPYGNGKPSVPGIIVIHAGPGAEEGAYGIWSHRSNMGSISRDGVTMSGYTMQPEEAFGRAEVAAVGVFCHEYGHILGLPDFYDISSSSVHNVGSEGLGAWDIMASGSWNDSGRKPSHFSARNKVTLGFGSAVVLSANMKHAPIIQAATSPICYLLQDNPGGSNPDMWWVENRQRTGFDAGLPGSGLLIYHMDAGGSQQNQSRYWVAVEEADNNNSLRLLGYRGQAGDAWPGTSNNRNFHDYSLPSSRTYDGELTEVSVLSISDPDSVMYADLGVYYAIPWVMLAGDSLTVSDNAPGGDGDGVFEAGETMQVWLEVTNVMAQSYYPTLHLEVDNPDVEILENDQPMGLSLLPTEPTENFFPVKVHLPDDFSSSIVTFTLTVISDSTATSHDRGYRTSFAFDQVLGRTSILLVNDDNGRDDARHFTDAFTRMRLPYVEWNKLEQGSPEFDSVGQYPFVFWMTGSYYPPNVEGTTLYAEDVAFMKAVLDNDGCLFLGSPIAATQLQALDPEFLSNYLHISPTGATGTRPYFKGLEGNAVGEGLFFTTGNVVNWNNVSPIIDPINGASSAFKVTRSDGVSNQGSCGVTYDGTYRAVTLSFGIECLADNRTADGFAPSDSLLARVLRFFVRGSATPVEEDPTDLLPTEFALEQNYPNPFNPTTTISYHIDAGLPQRTSLTVFNVLGQKVATLVDRIQSAGDYTVTWQGTDDGGARVASGVYFYRLNRGTDIETRKMMLLK